MSQLVYCDACRGLCDPKREREYKYEICDVWGRPLKLGLKINTTTQDICSDCVSKLITGQEITLPHAAEV